jgi:hypothetical protein
VDSKNFHSLVQRGQGKKKFAVEAARAAQGGINGIKTIGGANDNNL